VIKNPVEIALSFDKKYIYVTLEGENKIVKINMDKDIIESILSLDLSEMDFTDISSLDHITWLSVELENNILSPGQNKQVIFNINSNDLPESSYFAEYGIYSNDPANPELIIPITLNVEQTSITLDLTIYLEGPFDGMTMQPWLNPSYLPLIQPFSNYPWNYSGTENINILPNPNIIDWILIELRETTGDASTATVEKRIAQQAAFLLNNGSVVGLDGSSLLQFNLDISDNLFIILWHRNHLGIMSANPLIESEGVYSYDFTTASSQTYGGINAVKELVPGIWGMISADGNADGIVNLLDKNNVWEPQAGQSGYKSGDFNLDGQVNNPDKNDYWVPNEGSGCQVPE